MKTKLIMVLMMLSASISAAAATNPVKVHVAGTDWILPLQKVQAVQLYSVTDKKGYPGVETVIASWNKDNAHLTLGAAPVLGTSQNVPFASLSFRLPSRFFDTSNNTLMFGAFIGKEADKPHATVGVAASIALW